MSSPSEPVVGSKRERKPSALLLEAAAVMESENVNPAKIKRLLGKAGADAAQRSMPPPAQSPLRPHAANAPPTPPRPPRIDTSHSSTFPCTSPMSMSKPPASPMSSLWLSGCGWWARRLLTATTLLAFESGAGSKQSSHRCWCHRSALLLRRLRCAIVVSQRRGHAGDGGARPPGAPSKTSHLRVGWA